MSLQFEQVSILRGDLCIADTISLDLQAGKVYAVLGPNGVGKSSLMKAIFGDIPFQGEIRFQEQTLHHQKISKWRKKIGYMPQDTYIDASLTALEVVLLGKLNTLSLRISDEQLTIAVKLMQKLGIIHLAQRDVLSLSGGQRQMVMFAQVLLREPELLLLDEPVSALDMHHQCVLLEQVQQQTHKRDLVTIIILHDLNLAAQFADELILLDEGKIQAQGSAEQVFQRHIIERIYRVETHIFTDEASNTKAILPRRAITSPSHQEKPIKNLLHKQVLFDCPERIDSTPSNINIHNE